MHCNQNYSFNGRTENQTAYYLMSQSHQLPIHAEAHYASITLGKILRDQAGVDNKTVVFHSCRHTVAQQLVDAGCEQRLIEQVLGHSSKSMTARYSRAGLLLSLLAAAMEDRDWGWWPQK